MKKISLLVAGLMVSGLVSLTIAEEMKGGSSAAPAAAVPAKKHMKKTGKKSAAKPAAAAQEAKAGYACEMCNVKSDKPGKCPKCGMELKKI